MDTALPHDLPAVTALQLAARLGRADAPLILDVRKAPAFDGTTCVIAGALRRAPSVSGPRPTA